MGLEYKLGKINFFSVRMEVSEAMEGFSHAVTQATF